MKKLICLCVALMLLAGCSVKEPEPTILTGWQSMEGMQYYYAEDGSLLTGWQTIDGSRYYFAADGAMTTGWQDIGGKQFWLGEEGILVTGWQEVEGKKRYFLEDGALASGEVAIEDTLYHFAADGTPTQGFVEENGIRRYFQEGALVTGWLDLEEGRYYAGEDGAIHTGWLTLGEYDYYFFEDGTMAVGPQVIDEKQYYFTPRGIHIWLANPWNKIHEDYTVDLVEVGGYYKVDSSCYTALTQMMNACAEAGYEPMICSGYRTQSDQSYLFGNKVAYFEEQGLDHWNAQVRAARIVAIPGTSEHQLGLAVDLVSSDYYVLDESQATTRTQQWLMEHCWEYGFILRYPLGTTEITGIIYEPWHYRYVGLEVALELRDLGITLEEYLGAYTAEE